MTRRGARPGVGSGSSFEEERGRVAAPPPGRRVAALGGLIFSIARTHRCPIVEVPRPMSAPAFFPAGPRRALASVGVTYAAALAVALATGWALRGHGPIE